MTKIPSVAELREDMRKSTMTDETRESIANAVKHFIPAGVNRFRLVKREPNTAYFDNEICFIDQNPVELLADEPAKELEGLGYRVSVTMNGDYYLEVAE